ncbi:MAG: DUF3606 domain-containing protein [Bdellovibrionota bacterium]
MSDDLSKKTPQDASRIDVNERWELEYWSDRFKVEPDELKKAVKKVGVSAEAVKQHLQGQKAESSARR